MGTGTIDEAETQEEEEDEDEQNDFGFQVSLKSSTQENDACTNGETGPLWCGQDNKQDRKWTRSVRRLCNHDKFVVDEKWEEQKHRAT